MAVIYKTWAEIDAIASSGQAASTFALGDTKDIELTTGEVITVRIIGFDHDDLSDGSGKAGITFEMENCLESPYMINETDVPNGTNADGWEGCTLRPKLQPENGDIWTMLPLELSPLIRPVNKLTSVGNQSSVLKTTNDYLFLLSEVEIFGKCTYSFAGEGTQYAYYANASESDRIKYEPDGITACKYWTRSPDKLSPNAYSFVERNGGISRSGSEGQLGISFAFCVGTPTQAPTGLHRPSFYAGLAFSLAGPNIRGKSGSGMNSYNGVVLPALPATEYPYMTIVCLATQDGIGIYSLYLSKEKCHYPSLLYLDVPGKYLKYTAQNGRESPDKSWTYLAENENLHITGYVAIWANHDVLDSGSNVVLAASAPIPV